jgi:hypothetical protein
LGRIRGLRKLVDYLKKLRVYPAKKPVGGALPASIPLSKNERRFTEGLTLLSIFFTGLLL